MHKSIFFDPTKKRHTIVKRSIFFIGGVCCLVGIGYFLNLILDFEVSDLGLPKYTNVVEYRGQSLPGVGNVIIPELTFPKNPGLSPVPLKPQRELGTPIDIYAFYMEWQNGAINSLKDNLPKIDVLIPERLTLHGTGLLELNPYTSSRTLTYVRDNSAQTKILPLINNFNKQTGKRDDALVSQITQNPQIAKGLIAQIVGYVERHDLGGVVLGFRNLTGSTWQSLAPFIAELGQSLKNENPKNMVLVTVPFGDAVVPYQLLADSADKLMVMAYGEHGLTTQAGPIASRDWYTSGLNQLTKVLTPDQFVVTLGSYGYDWMTGSWQATPLTWQESLTLLEQSQGDLRYDRQTLSPGFGYLDSRNVSHHVRYADATTFYNQILIGNNKGVQSYGLRKLGSEDPSLWQLFDEQVFYSHDRLAAIQSLRRGYDIGVRGADGGLLFGFRESASTGTRFVQRNIRGLINNQDIQTYPQSYVVDRYAVGTGKQILLTFDDGPSEYTSRILDVLKEYGVPAVFFVVGGSVEQYPDVIKRIADEGHVLGNSTFSHKDILLMNPEKLRLELEMTQKEIEALTYRSTHLFRQPYDPNNMSDIGSLAVLNDMGYYSLGSNIDPHDWDAIGSGEIVQRTLMGAEKGGVLLLHDGGGDRSQTIAALPALITKLREKGYEFVDAGAALGVPVDAVVPPLTGRQRFLSFCYWLGWYAWMYFATFLRHAFIFALVAGLFRLSLVIAFALYKKLRGPDYYFDDRYQPFVSVIVPAYNEGIVIVKTVENLLQSDYKSLEIIIVDDGSRDDTLEIAQKHFGHHPRITVLTQENGGKSAALNHGIRKSRGEIVIVQDADTIFNTNAISLLVRHFNDPTVGGVAGNVKVGNTTNFLARCQYLEYTSSQSIDRSAFHVMNCITVVPGAIGAWRKTALVQVNGLSSDTLAEDSDLTVAVLGKGWRVVYEDRAIAWTEAPDNLKAFLKQRFRWLFGTLQVAWKHRGMLFNFRHPWLGRFSLPYMYIYNMFFPLLIPILDLLSFVNIFLILFYFFANWSIGVSSDFQMLMFYSTIYFLLDAFLTGLAFWLERERKLNIALLFPLQRVIYRFLMYGLGVRAIYTALSGKGTGRNKLARMGTVDMSLALGSVSAIPAPSVWERWLGDYVYQTQGRIYELLNIPNDIMDPYVRELLLLKKDVMQTRERNVRSFDERVVMQSRSE